MIENWCFFITQCLMELFVFLLILVVLLYVVIVFRRENKKLQTDILELTRLNENLSSSISEYRLQVSKGNKKISILNEEIDNLNLKIEDLSRYQEIIDVEEHIIRLKNDCALEISKTKEDQERNIQKEIDLLEAHKKSLMLEAEQFKEKIKQKIESVETFLEHHSQKTMAEVELKAKNLLEDYYDAAQRKNELNKLVKALENKLQGYGDEYLLPNQAILEDLIDGYEHLDATERLKSIKNEVKTAIKQGNVAECDYVEETRKTTAIAFITNAFNGKADVHISRLRHDNVGKLVKSMEEDYLLLNNFGKAFRNVRIKPSYLALRVEELKFAALILDFKEREREEQREIREQIREEEKARREYERAMKEASKDEDLLKKAYEKAKKEFELATGEQKTKYDLKMTELMSRLHEAEERSKRALSMAQQTRAGHVYVISNIGSFGDNVLKLGMTRRLEPMDRVRELGDASVPFTFDVHAMIYSEDAPTLERKLHHHFNHDRLNKVNYRKEFFKTSLGDVKSYLEELGIQAKFTLKAEAQQYRESQKIEMMPDRMHLEDEIEKRQLMIEEHSMVDD